MPRYIDADKKIHIQIFNEEHEEYIVLEQTIAECLDSYTDEGCPRPADVQEVKHGKWGNKGIDGELHCSLCGAYIDGHDRQMHNFHFCYNCGAKMNGKGN